MFPYCTSVDRYLAVTQFQGIAARQAFPSFDEVDLKATFNVTVVSKPPSVTLSNMPVIATQDRYTQFIRISRGLHEAIV